MNAPVLNNGHRISGKGRVNRSKPLAFTFAGETYTGYEGDTLASALLANGVHLVGRSFKYHRPRGIIAAGAEEPNALVGVTRNEAQHVPNVRATVQELYDGLQASAQNAWPSLKADIGEVNGALSPFFPAGFYYKTFKWPAKAWDNVYEPFIRKAAGLGEAPEVPDPDRYTNRFSHCDVLVAGGGASGLAAALAAGRAGKSVMLIDETPEFGGWLLTDLDAKVAGRSGTAWVADVVAELERMSNVTLLPRTTVFGYFQQNMIGLAERVTEHLASPPARLPRERMWQVRAGQVILAQGAVERHMVFPGNDRPGVMMAGAARTYLNRYGVAAGSKVALYAATDEAYAAAFDLHDAGVEVTAIIDHRADPGEQVLSGAAARNIEVIPASCIAATAGRLRIRQAVARPNLARDDRDDRKIECDALLMSGGWTPSVHLYSQSRGKVTWDEATRRFIPGDSPQENVSVGACNGTDALNDALHEAWLAGGADEADAPAASTPWSMEGGMQGATPAAGNGKAFVDYQNDVTAKDIRLAVREGFRSIEHVKRYTTNGMATDQGKLSNMHGLAIAAEVLNRPLPEVGLTTFRAPYTPTTFGTFVGQAKGELFDPERRTPMDAWSEKHGAEFEPVSHWRRAWYYPRDGESMHEAVSRECRTVREAAGMFDASTLGKIEVAGPDAVAFMEKMYTNGWAKLAVGRCKYGIMLREDGFIYDDGVVGRIAEDRFHVTTTTGGAPRVLNHMEDYLQTEFPDMRVWLTSTTEQWAVIAVQGPKAREIVQPFTELDLSNEAFKHMSVAETTVCGVHSRLFRMSFTGETGFEVNVPADYGEAVWEALWTRAEALGACAYGTETMHVLRAEKGYIIVGQDTDGTVTPYDAGLSWAIAKSKPDYVGKRGLERTDLKRTDRRQLVGLRAKDRSQVLIEGAQIVEDPNQPIPMKMVGWVSSAYHSDAAEGGIALALVENGFDRMGDTLYVPTVEKKKVTGSVAVEVVKPVFVDVEGKRLHG